LREIGAIVVGVNGNAKAGVVQLSGDEKVKVKVKVKGCPAIINFLWSRE